MRIKTLSFAVVTKITMLIGTVVLALLGYSSVSRAGDDDPRDRPMTFTLVRNALSCEPVCAEWISAEGIIYPDSHEKLKAMIKSLHGRILPVILQSDGGDVRAAMDMGLMLHRADMPAYVGATMYASCRPGDEACKDKQRTSSISTGWIYSYQAFCYSACPIMLAGAPQRRAGNKTIIGVHQPWKEGASMDGHKIGDIVSDEDLHIRAVYNGYWRQLGIDEALTGLIESTPPKSMRILTRDELLRLKLITSEGAADDLVALNFCKDHPENAACTPAQIAQMNAQ